MENKMETTESVLNFKVFRGFSKVGVPLKGL